MKKGNGHIDWAISIGIFIIYLLLLFIFVRPGQVEEYKGDLLLSIVEKNFKDDFYWRLLEIPLFVNTSDTSKTGGGLITGAAVGIGESGSSETLLIDVFPFKFSSNNILIIDSELNILPFDLENPLDQEREIIFNITDFQSDKKLIYEILYSESMNLGSTKPTFDPINILNVSNVTIFGVGEYSIGVSEDKFKEISQDYNKLKIDWRYPKLKDFSITIYDEKEIILSLNDVQPSENLNIYVLQWSDFILYNDTTKKPVTVNVKAW